MYWLAQVMAGGGKETSLGHASGFRFVQGDGQSGASNAGPTNLLVQLKYGERPRCRFAAPVNLRRSTRAIPVRA